jgi:PAS domain S-box-containing protein
LLTLPNLLYPLFLFAALVSIVATVVLVIRIRTPLAGWGGLFSLALALHMLSYFFVLTSTTPGAIQFWYRILIFAISSQAITWLLFVIVFSSRAHWINWRNIIIAWAVPMLAVYLLFGKSELNLLLLSHNKEVVASLAILPREIGWFGNLFITYIVGLQFLTIGLLIKMLPTSTENFRSLILVVGLGNTFTILAPIVDLLAIYPFAPLPNFQLVCILISVLAFFVAVLLSAEGLLPIARTRIFEEIQDAVLVLDHHNNLIDMNPSGAKIIGKSEATTLGRPLSMVWPQGTDLLANQPKTAPFDGEHPFIVNGLEMTFDVNVSPALHPTSRERIGQVIVLRNVTGRERMEKALQEHANELRRNNKLITALSMVASRLGAAVDSKLILDTLGTEMRKLGLDCGVVSIDPSGEIATIKYVSFNPALLKVFEKIAGFTLVGYNISKQYWPGDRLLKTKAPTWYSNPKALLRGLFAKVPEGIVIKARQLFNIQSIGQMCILPLISEEKVIGAMPVWGVDLQQEDSPILAVFASQVAGILQKARQFEEERQLNLTLARSKAFTSALSAIAAAFSQRQDKQRIFDILEMELAKLGLGYLIVRLSEDHQFASVENISTPSEILSAIQRFTGVNLKGYVIDRKYWGALAEEYFYNGRYLFSDNPIEFTSLVIPKISSGLLKKALEQSMGPIEQKAIYLPLIDSEKAYGILGIWGVDLQEEDALALSVFASQVAGMLQNVVSFENETRRANELIRSNSMILALSKVASHLESSSDTVQIFNTVGKELKKLGLDSIVGILDSNKQNLRIEYISVSREAIGWAKKTTGLTLKELIIPRRLWPTEKVIDENITYWDPNLMKGALNMFPILPKSLHKPAMKMAGINFEDPVCYLPLANENDVIGLLAVWGAGLKRDDVSALSVLASQITTAIRNANLYETESRRAKELDILLKASEATSSSLDFDTVMHTLASQLLEISRFENCFISEWDKETHTVVGRLDHSRIFWKEGKRDSYSMKDYPRTKQVLLTGIPIILQGNFEAEEKQWMEELNRTAVIILALYAKDKVIGLVELANIKKDQLFDSINLDNCKKILSDAASWLVEPLPANAPKKLFELEGALIQAAGASVCSLSEWDRLRNRVLTIAVFSNVSWEEGQGPRFDPDLEIWRDALYHGNTSIFKSSSGDIKIDSVVDQSLPLEAESLIVFPLQKGSERIGVIEIYDFNHRTEVSPEQITLLRTIADKASFSIENARLLSQTQKRLEEQIALHDEKEVLLKEIHHRVKNNLQIISSLLSLQARQVTDDKTLRALGDSQSRVRSMALIHEKLYQSQSMARIDFGEYVKSLASDLFRSYRRNFSGIQLNVQVDEVALNLDHAVSCGLILNELMTNALKYAFPDGRNGTIWIELRTQPGHLLSLRVADDGVGIPLDFDTPNAKSLGLQLVNSLVRQLDGTMELESANGTSFCISFEY